MNQPRPVGMLGADSFRDLVVRRLDLADDLDSEAELQEVGIDSFGQIELGEILRELLPHSNDAEIEQVLGVRTSLRDVYTRYVLATVRVGQ